MILPQSYPAVLFLMVLSLLCLGSWASLFKFAGKWRFELFYLDFAIGLLLASVLFAFTLGNIGYDGFNFIDDLQHVRTGQLARSLRGTSRRRSGSRPAPSSTCGSPATPAP